MIRDVSENLAFIAQRLMTEVAPQTTSNYAAANTAMIAGLLGALAQESERAVATRMADIAEIRALLGEAASFAAEPESLHLQHVNALHAEAQAALIEHHAWAESNDPERNEAIWALLRRQAERHFLQM